MFVYGKVGCLFGYQIDAQGLHLVSEKVQAVQEARELRNVSELKWYLGLLTYYSRFLPNMAMALNPLYNVLRKAVPWSSTARERKAFEDSKQLLVSTQNVTTPLDTKPQEGSWELTPNLSETSPEDRETSQPGN